MEFRSLREIDNIVKDFNKASIIRRKYIEQKRFIKLENIGKHILNFNELVGKNIENPIGAIQIPLGIAGPLPIEGEFAKGEFYIPLATTEGALVAGINRGCSLIRRSNTKVLTKVIKSKMTRAPVFKVNNVRDAIIFSDYIIKNIAVLKELARIKSDDVYNKISNKDNYEEIKALLEGESEKLSRYTSLISIRPEITGNLVFVEFSFDTGDAMGMNMATIASDYICRWLVRHSPVDVKLVGVSGNFCVDKKPNAKALHTGRGKTVVAEVKIDQKYVREFMKTTPEDLRYLNIAKNFIGSMISGSLGFNAHFANIISAIFLATGQDMAHISEASVGFTYIDVVDGHLYASVYIPDLPVGTVGGGTRLPTARECLRILDCEGGGNPPGANAKKLAEIISATVLVGEINLLSAIATNELARAHQILGR